MSMFDYNTTRETKFKVGDWVRNKIDINEKQMVFGTREASNEEFEFLYFSNNKMGLLQDYELWQPEEGEFVVRKFGNTSFIVGKFGTEGFTKDCEPFIGELPSFIKER